MNSTQHVGVDKWFVAAFCVLVLGPGGCRKDARAEAPSEPESAHPTSTAAASTSVGADTVPSAVPASAPSIPPVVVPPVTPAPSVPTTVGNETLPDAPAAAPASAIVAPAAVIPAQPPAVVAAAPQVVAATATVVTSSVEIAPTSASFIDALVAFIKKTGPNLSRFRVKGNTIFFKDRGFFEYGYSIVLRKLKIIPNDDLMRPWREEVQLRWAETTDGRRRRSATVPLRLQDVGLNTVAVAYRGRSFEALALHQGSVNAP